MNTAFEGFLISIGSIAVNKFIEYIIYKRKKLYELKIKKIDEAETAIAYITEIIISYTPIELKEKEYMLNENKLNLYIAQFRKYEELKELLKEFKQYCYIVIDDEKNRENSYNNKNKLEDIYCKIVKEFKNIIIYEEIKRALF